MLGMVHWNVKGAFGLMVWLVAYKYLQPQNCVYLYSVSFST